MVWLRTFTLALFAALACQQAVGETVLLEFTTQNCGPCRRMRPVVQQLAAEGYAVREVDASSQPQAADQYRVTKFPTFLVLVDRREYARLEGGTDHRTLVEMIHRATAIAAQKQQSMSADPAVAFVNSGAETVNPFPSSAANPGPSDTIGRRPTSRFRRGDSGGCQSVHTGLRFVVRPASDPTKRQWVRRRHAGPAKRRIGKARRRHCAPQHC